TGAGAFRPPRRFGRRNGMSVAAEAVAVRRNRAAFLGAGMPRALWSIQGGMLANSFGTGMVMPFVLIYLRDVRGFPLATAGLVAATTEPSTFTIAFGVDAATFLLFAASTLLVPAVEPPARGSRRAGSYLDVLRDRPFMAVLGLNTLFVAVGLAQFEVGVPI